jgi:hypothetical protein
VYDIGDPKPFRQVWSLVLTLNDLDYVLQENDVVVIGTREGSLAPARTATPPPAAAVVDEDEDPRVQRFYRVNNEPDQVATILRRAVPASRSTRCPARTPSWWSAPRSSRRPSRRRCRVRPPAEVVQLEQRTYFLSNARAGGWRDAAEHHVVAGGEDGRRRAASTTSPSWPSRAPTA